MSLALWSVGKRKKIAELIESQTRALDKFIVKETQIPIDDSLVDVIHVDVILVDVIPIGNVDAMPIPIDDIHVDAVEPKIFLMNVLMITNLIE